MLSFILLSLFFTLILIQLEIRNLQKKNHPTKSKNKVYDYDQVVTFDCDDTLVMWKSGKEEKKVEIKDPYLKGVSYHLKPHEEHIALMKKYKARGFLVIVWSAGGVKWAKNVVEALELQDYCDIVLTKPCRYVDDLNCEKWMGNRVYIK